MINILITKATKTHISVGPKFMACENWNVLILPCIVNQVKNCTIGVAFSFQILS